MRAYMCVRQGGILRVRYEYCTSTRVKCGVVCYPMLHVVRYRTGRAVCCRVGGGGEDGDGLDKALTMIPVWQIPVSSSALHISATAVLGRLPYQTIKSANT